MTALPLPTGLRGSEESRKQIEIVKNLYYTSETNGTLNPRAGVEQVLTANGRCRGIGLFKEELYFVANDRLLRIEIINPFDVGKVIGNLQIIDLGEITGSVNCVLVAGFTNLLIMVKGGQAFTYSKENNLQLIDDPSFITSVSACYVQGRFVFVPADGESFFWSELQDPGNILPSNFADAENFPDPNKLCFSLNQQLYIGGTRSFQRLRYDAELDTFISQAGTSSNIGYVAGAVDYRESFVFIGRGFNGGFSIFDIRNPQQAISNGTIDDVLNKEYTLEELESVDAQSFNWNGDNIAVFNLPRHTLVYYGDWALWSSGISGNAESVWDIGFTQFAYGLIFTGDTFSGKIGVLTNDQSDYGKDIEFELVTYIRSPEGRANFRIKNIFLECTTGQKNENRTISLAISENGGIFGDPVPLGLGDKGDLNLEISWGSPIGTFRNYCGIKWRWTGDISVTIDGASFE